MASQLKTPVRGLFIENKVIQKRIMDGNITCWIKVGAYKYKSASQESSDDSAEAVLYNHYCGPNGWALKAYIEHSRVCNVSELTTDEHKRMGGPSNSREFLRYLREFVSESLEIDSVITLVQFRDIRGNAVTSKNWRTVFKKGAQE